MKPYLLAIDWNHSYHPGFTTAGFMGLIVSLDEKKLKFFFKLLPSEIANFEGTSSGNKKHIHDLIVLCVFRAVEAVKGGK